MLLDACLLYRACSYNIERVAFRLNLEALPYGGIFCGLCRLFAYSEWGVCKQCFPYIINISTTREPYTWIVNLLFESKSENSRGKVSQVCFQNAAIRPPAPQHVLCVCPKVFSSARTTGPLCIQGGCFVCQVVYLECLVSSLFINISYLVQLTPALKNSIVQKKCLKPHQT